MKSSIKTILVGFFCVAIVACSSGGGGPVTPPIVVDPTPPPAAGSFGDGRLGELVEWARSTRGLPAMGTVIVVDGQVVEIAAEGLRSASGSLAVSESDLWHVGSLTKGLTATLAGVLVDMSVIDWDTRVLDVWPELNESIHPRLRQVTLRHLLTHTAGLRRVDTVPSKYGDLAAGSIIEKRRRFAEELLAEAPIGEIGRESYSNAGYIVAAALFETLMSAPWEALLSDYVFAALAIDDAGFGAPDDGGNLAQPHGHWDRGVNYEPVAPGPDADIPQIFGPAGTVHMSMMDYAKFMIAHIDGYRGTGSLLTAGTFRELHTPADNGSAMGWGVRNSEAWLDTIELTHAGSNQRWYAIVRLVPELRAGALFVVNAGGDLPYDAIDALDDLLVARFKNSR